MHQTGTHPFAADQARTKQTARKPTHPLGHRNRPIEIDSADEGQGKSAENKNVSQGGGTNEPNEPVLGEDAGGASQ